ncbi:MAG: beta-galactosidase [Suilimivivens sp.]
MDRKKNEIIYGVAYYAEYMPYERIDTDLKMMKKAGINTIRIAESSWSTWEPHDGIFDFTILHQVLTAALTYDIKVIIGTPTYAIPAWLVKKYPDILAITHGGPSLYGHRQNMDITHPGYLFHAERIIRKLMEECASHPQVIGYQLDNETKSYDTAGPRVQEKFVDYLKDKFKTTDALNRAFGLTYWSNRINDWNDFPDVRGTINASLGAEFKKFQRQLVTEFLTWQASIVKEYASEDQFITQNFDFAWTDHSVGLQPEANQREAAKALTIAGVDIYHPSAADLTGAEIAMGGAIGRSIKKAPYLVLETQAQGNPGWLPYPGQLRLQAYSHLSAGARSVMYWHWHSIHHSFETYWKGVLSHDLKENETYREVCRIGREFSEYKELLSYRPLAKCAIILSNEALTGLFYFPVGEKLSYNNIMRWLFDALYRMNVTCDFIYPEDVLHMSCEELLTRYDLLLMPGLYSMEAAIADKLNDYVKNGGHLIGTFRSAFANEYLEVYADALPHGLTECFGMTYDQFTVPKNVTLTFAEEISDSGSFVCAEEFMELLHPICQDTLSFAEYAYPAYEGYSAVTFHPYGSGSAAYIGCYFDSSALETLLKSILSKMNLSVPCCHFPVICKKGISEQGKQVLYVFNYSDKMQEFCLAEYEKEPALTDSCFVSLFDNKEASLSDRISLKPWDVQIFFIS